jgi:hypothetical protein
VSQLTTPTGPLEREPVTLINAFTVPTDEADRFLHRWKRNAQIMATSPDSSGPGCTGRWRLMLSWALSTWANGKAAPP